MNVVVGDATGRLRVVSLKVDGPIKKMGTQEATRGGVTALSWAGAENRESEVAMALSKGTIEIWNTVNQEKVAEMQGLPLKYDDDKYIGLSTLRTQGGISQDVERRLVSATASGHVSIAPWLPIIPDLDSEENDELLAETLSRTQITIHKKQRNDERTQMMKEREEAYLNSSAYFRCGRNLEKFRISPTEDILAAGGKDNRFRLFDIETQKSIYSTRNLPNNWLNLAQPNWDMDFAFFGQHSSTNPRPNSNGYCIATTTGYKEIRIYDTRDGTGRSSQFQKLDDHPARSIAITHDENYILAGDAAGKIHKLDLRKNLNPLGSMKGHCGSVRQLSMHPTLNMVAAVGLDRYLRIFDVDTRKPLKEVYLTQKLSDCLFSEVVPGAKAKSFVGSKTAAQQLANNEQPTDDALWARFLTMGDGEDAKKAIKKESGEEGDEIELMDDEEENQFDSDDFDEMGEGEFDPSMLFDGEGEFDAFNEEGEGEFDLSMFYPGEGEIDADALLAAGEGEEDEFDFNLNEEDEDDDFPDEDDEEDGQEFSCGFTILGADGKPIGGGKSMTINRPPAISSKPASIQSSKKSTPQIAPATKSQGKQIQFVTEPVKRKLQAEQDTSKKQRR